MKSPVQVYTYNLANRHRLDIPALSFRMSLMGLLLLFMFPSCTKYNKRQKYETAVAEWIDKEIVFPDSMELTDGRFTTCPQSEFTIISYFDSLGCTGCKLRLPYWNEFMAKTDSLIGQGKVGLMIIVNTPNIAEIRKLINESGFKCNIYIDEDGLLDKINHFPELPELRTFLIDRSNHVLLMGNPTTSKAVENLYLSQISSNVKQHDNDAEMQTYEYDFDKVRAGHKVCHIFNLTNESSDTLKVRKVISSCECTEGEISSRIIAPGEMYSVTVTFQDDTPGEFERSISVYFENNIPKALFELKGVITNNNL